MVSPKPPTTDISSPHHAYEEQHRGGDESYASYYAGMDKSMRQKVALTTAFFPPSGTLADMGCGSGSGSFDLASLFAGLRVIGVDIAEQAVEHARAHFQKPNLTFRLGDIADPLFPADSLDGVLNSSVWHHLTSFNGFSLREVERALKHQAAALRTGGVLIVRDFVVPRFPETIWLDLPEHDGEQDGPITGLSTSAAFVRFCQAFRSSQNLDAPVPFVKLETPKPGWARYQVAGRAATEFLLHKDYRADWDAECKEEYTFYTQAEYEAAFRKHDLRIVLSVELQNPWIVENRFVGRCALFQTDGTPLPFPPTNHLIVGEKVPQKHGVCLSVRTEPLDEPAFLRLHTLRHKKTGQTFQLAEREHPVVDVLPWFRHGARILVLAKRGFPRPFATTLLDSPSLDGATLAGYLTEAFTAQMPLHKSALDLLPHTTADLLARRAGLPGHAVAPGTKGLAYYTSPGGMSEYVQSFFCELCLAKLPCDADGFPVFPPQAPAYTPFSTAGDVKPFSAPQLLRAAQVGGLEDARLELNVYELLRTLGEPLGPWIGIELSLHSQTCEGFVPGSTEQVLSVITEPVFEAMPSPPARPGFLAVHRAHVKEIDCDDQVLRSASFELCAPRLYSLNTLSVLPVVKLGDSVLVGLEHRDLPAVELHTQSRTSGLLTCPAWRLPKTVASWPAALEFVQGNLLAQFAAKALRLYPLGGKYFPSIGATPEVVYPFVAEIDAASLPHTALAFVPLAELLDARKHLEDAHLLVVLHRLAHALEPA